VTPAIMDEIARLQAVPGISRAAVDIVCCEDGKTTIYIGVEEPGTPAQAFDPAPSGNARLPEAVLRGYREFQAAFDEAIKTGNFTEDDDQGHALMHFPAARAAQEGFVQLASEHRQGLVQVLHESSDAEQRAIAAQVLAYFPDKGAIAADLARAARDPYSTVRNNSIRALAIIAGFGHRHPELGISVPADPLVNLLNSLIWTDRNKSSLALMRISEARDPALLEMIKRKALPSLVEMAQWKAMGHAFAPLVILGRIAGMADPAIFQALEANKRDTILSAVRQ